MQNISLSLGCLILSSACLAQTTWVQATPKTSPPARWSCAHAHDLVRGRTILFGGTSSGVTYRNDTWEYDGTTWVEIKPKNVPPVRRLMSMVFHLARVNTVLFGGSGSGGAYLNDTWVWDGKDWTQMKPTTSPSARFNAALAYDSARARTVLFGGLGASGYTNDTWEWDGANWTKITTKNAPAVRYANMVYDAARKRIVLYGGAGAGGFLGDTWEYDGSDWTQITPAKSPPARAAVAMVYDTARQLTVLFGGAENGGSANWYKQGTWVYDGKTWTQVKPAKEPPGRYDFDLGVYDSRRKRIVIFGGRLQTATAGGGDTWEYVASQTLSASPATISIASGGTQTFSLDAGAAQASRLYWIFGSLTGTSPGVTLNSPAGNVTIPLNPDIWTDLTIALANSALLTNTRGALGTAGKATATFNLPKITNQSAVGVKFYHAFLVYDANNNFYMASNPVELMLVK